MEYALATGGEPHLWTAEKDMSWVQLALLDVAAVFAAAGAAIVALALWALRRCLRQRRVRVELAGKKLS